MGRDLRMFPMERAGCDIWTLISPVPDNVGNVSTLLVQSPSKRGPGRLTVIVN